METQNQTTARFKTNIKCGNCVATVTPFLNEAVGEGHWQVNLQDPNRTLTVDAGQANRVKQAVEQAGYKAEPLA